MLHATGRVVMLLLFRVKLTMDVRVLYCEGKVVMVLHDKSLCGVQIGR